MQYRPTFSFRSAAKRSSSSGLTQTASRNASYGPFSILLIMYQGKLRPLIIYTDIPVNTTCSLLYPGILVLIHDGQILLTPLISQLCFVLMVCYGQDPKNAFSTQWGRINKEQTLLNSGLIHFPSNLQSSFLFR